MRINSSTLSMDASTSHTDVRKSGRGLVTAQPPFGNQGTNFTLNVGSPGFFSESVHWNRQVNEITAHSEIRSSVHDPCSGTEELISGMVAGVLDKDVNVTLEPGTEKGAKTHDNTSDGEAEEVPGVKIGGSPFEVAFATHSLQYEHQYVHVVSEGAVSTADGRDISFSLDLRMERESFSYHNFAIEGGGGVFLDPLVLNFDTELDLLSNTSFSFDLNGDGEEESLTGLGAGSGFLALDLNGDEEINDGLELFGPLSGHGYRELAVHDSDKNNWIDENDPIFNKLMVWMHAGSDAEELMTLKEAGVGAISLSNVDSLFDLKDESNAILGQVTSSGIFLTEDGEVRSVQEIEYAMPQTQEEMVADGGGVADISQAIITLRSMITRHKQRVQAMATERLAEQAGVSQKDLLQKKFWEWQEVKGKTV